jgi:mRNA-degrading endonuclease RelE of RelBE toxin-antitoxin system
VTHKIVFTENAIDDFKSLDARRQATVRDAIGIHLTHEPAKESKSRIKRLKELGHPQYRLRVDDLRVFYDIAGEDVVILAIMSKERTEKWLEKHGEK